MVLDGFHATALEEYDQGNYVHLEAKAFKTVLDSIGASPNKTVMFEDRLLKHGACG